MIKRPTEFGLVGPEREPARPGAAKVLGDFGNEHLRIVAEFVVLQRRAWPAHVGRGHFLALVGRCHDLPPEDERPEQREKDHEVQDADLTIGADRRRQHCLTRSPSQRARTAVREIDPAFVQSCGQQTEERRVDHRRDHNSTLWQDRISRPHARPNSRVVITAGRREGHDRGACNDLEPDGLELQFPKPLFLKIW
jgi:hypothetical protein